MDKLRKYLSNLLEIEKGIMASEKLAGNIVKEEHARGAIWAIKSIKSFIHAASAPKFDMLTTKTTTTEYGPSRLAVPCVWKSEDLEGAIDEDWFTGCGEQFSFLDNGPVENDFKFCPYCGRDIKVETEAENA